MRLTEELVEAFLACRLPKTEWTHHAHLTVGLWHLLRYAPDDALIKLRQRIQAYNLATGTPNTASQGYHETLTRFYLWLIQKFLQQVQQQQPIEDLAIEKLAEQLTNQYGDQSLPLKYYSQEWLMSPTARQYWVEPDLLPLSHLDRE